MTHFDAVVVSACPAICDPELYPLAGTLDQPRHCARLLSLGAEPCRGLSFGCKLSTDGKLAVVHGSSKPVIVHSVNW